MTSFQPISIWSPETLAGRQVFLRPEVGPFGDHFAARRVIPLAKTARHRICFFGESVAAGYLYAPHLTPAMVLESQLNHLCGPGTYEVIDLARTNETLAGLASTVKSSMQLEPDLLVIFTGNNWNLLETAHVSPYNPVLRERRTYAEKLAAEGVAGPMAWAAGELFTKVTTTFESIAAAVAASVPVILVVPEVNLADWASRQPPVRLPGAGNARWFEGYRQALCHFDSEAWSEMRDTALSLLALDDGTCPTTFRLLAIAYGGAGDWDRARDAARAEIDCCQYANLCFMSAPQINNMGRKLLQRQAARPGFQLVDLAKVFAAHASPLPARDLFLDYCHLTVKGMQLAMAAVSTETIHLLEKMPQPLADVLQSLPDPVVAAEVDAVAKFGAAMHNAHRLLGVSDRGPLLAHWCDQALLASPAIADTMLDVVAARTSGLPAMLTRAQTRNRQSAYPLSLQHGWRYDHLDFPLIEAMYRALSQRDPASAKKLETILLDSIRTHVELTASHLWEPLARPYPELMPTDDLERHASLRAFWPVTEFGFLAAADRDLLFKCSLRAPTQNMQMAVHVNGLKTGVLAISERWGCQTLHLPRELLKRGINKLGLFWPEPKSFSADPLTEVAAHLAEDRETSPHPVYGELFRLSLSALD